ncbi:hypothetical protein AMECASPLE_029341 [Ameca splendens]|uniref:Uncharacterized protein n=1 Tax=Ameca splendens TaxID=208324 RepID=A0ABV0ZFH1_9TELE
MMTFKQEINFSVTGRSGVDSYLQHHWATSRVHPGQIASPLRATQRDKAQTTSNQQLIVMFLDCDRMPEYMNKLTKERGEHASSKQKVPKLGLKSGAFLLQGNSAKHCILELHH